MKKMKFLAVVAVLVLFSLACALTSGVGQLVGGKSAGTSVTDLWPDVPKMDGMNKVSVDLPLTAKLAIQAFVRASSQGEGTLDFIAYNTKSTPEEVESFYSVDKMSQAGWNMQDQTGCQAQQGLATQVVSNAGLCFFGKDNGGGKASYLVLFIGQDDKTKDTQVFFIRVEATNPPTATP
jgi:hypothetical protein